MVVRSNTLHSSASRSSRIHAPFAGLLSPADTVMDLNIGAALWLAAQGEGCVRLVLAGQPAVAAARLGALLLKLSTEPLLLCVNPEVSE